MVNDNWIFGLLVIWLIVDVWDLRPSRLKKAKDPIVPVRKTLDLRTLTLAEKTKKLQAFAARASSLNLNSFTPWEQEFIASFDDRKRYSPRQLAKIDELIFRASPEEIHDEFELIEK